MVTLQSLYFLNLQCKQAHIAHIPHYVHRNLVKFLKSNFAILKARPNIVQNQAFKETTVASAMELVIQSLLIKKQELVSSRYKSWDVLLSTREITNLRQDNPISVAELCTSLSISHRSLQYHFEQVLHTSPLAYLRAERLNRVRHSLKTAHSVTEAATHWGFWHFGHFSQEYKKMFGELPSTTFKRLHQLG